jgi:hypothetical protein
MPQWCEYLRGRSCCQHPGRLWCLLCVRCLNHCGTERLGPHCSRGVFEHGRAIMGLSVQQSVWFVVVELRHMLCVLCWPCGWWSCGYVILILWTIRAKVLRAVVMRQTRLLSWYASCKPLIQK